MTFLKIDKINVYYGDIQAIFNLSLTVEKGEVVSIVGGNGAGKSTLLRTISGLLFPASGEISFENQKINSKQPEKIVDAGIIHVPEGRKLFSLMTVKENLIIGAYNKRADGKTEETLQSVYNLFPRLKERENQLAMTLSGGEQQMAAIGRGIMALPKILMLDEPSLGLAPILMKDIFATIRKIADLGTTVLLVEQDVKNSLSLSDRAYVLEHGQVVMEGNGKELLANPHIKEAYLGM
ncbi:MAG: ABC transporter ATP-binding protein [Deltaproteobacteria bacterium]|nr:ABC transporter ATP-binding protein [Deltaproteobacteria bacterium]